MRTLFLLLFFLFRKSRPMCLLCYGAKAHITPPLQKKNLLFLLTVQMHHGRVNNVPCTVEEGSLNNMFQISPLTFNSTYLLKKCNLCERSENVWSVSFFHGSAPTQFFFRVNAPFSNKRKTVESIHGANTNDIIKMW